MGRQKWRVLGRVHNSNAEVMSMLSHAAVPYAEDIGGGFFRVYFSSRDKDNRSFTHSLIFDIENPIKILELDVSPVLVPGVFGSFDADGAMSSWITQSEDKRYLYYVGWNNQSEKKIFRNAIGLAISKDNGPFEKISSGPILDRSIFDSGFTASCSVLKVENEWRMWYLSCIGWEFVQGSSCCGSRAEGCWVYDHVANLGRCGFRDLLNGGRDRLLFGWGYCREDRVGLELGCCG